MDELTKKKINIGIELIKRPKILFVENPMINLQLSESLNLIKVFDWLKSLGITVVMSLREPKWQVLERCTHLIFINEGYVSFSGRP